MWPSVISRATYDSVVELLPDNVCETPDFLHLAEQLQLPVDVLVHIHELICQRYVKMNHHAHKAVAPDYCARYLAGEDVCTISTSAGFPPCMIMRLLLEQLGLSKEGIKKAMNNPKSLPSKIQNELQDSEIARLQSNIEDARTMDRIYSPFKDTARRVSGMEYEALLCESLRLLDVPFLSEDDLRSMGYVKTPDVLLQVPISVEGRVVQWIDSKATFGDESSHSFQYNEQFQQYVNRYGPGMVIYWFGFVRELQGDENVLLVERFPTRVMQLPRVAL